MGREEQLLSASIRDTLREAHKAESKISYEMEGNRTLEDIDEENTKLEEAQDTLRWCIRKLYRDVGMLAERMSMPLLAKRIAAEFDKTAETDLAEMKTSPYDIGLISKHIGAILGHFDSIAVMTDGQAITGLDTFRTILENTPAIMTLTGIDPKNEKDVRRAVFDVLKIAFHDAMMEITVGQLLKTFKPDLGVRSLMAAAEYKFVGNETELKVAMEGIYADMRGYHGHDWRSFFAVFYTTDAIVHRDRIIEEFSGVKADLNWTPIIVTGKGARKPRKSGLKA
ncbi:hypothetical protein [Oleomonas cavernae]|uniref:hypothetical protein n=1 Tax=Oleomonas cavernae TaxID=2320859 RepID=UPI0011C3779E|nr:hypothetical protein [Oleomonas cavernae]